MAEGGRRKGENGGVMRWRRFPNGTATVQAAQPKTKPSASHDQVDDIGWKADSHRGQDTWDHAPKADGRRGLHDPTGAARFKSTPPVWSALAFALHNAPRYTSPT